MDQRLEKKFRELPKRLGNVERTRSCNAPLQPSNVFLKIFRAIQSRTWAYFRSCCLKMVKKIKQEGSNMAMYLKNMLMFCDQMKCLMNDTTV